MGVDAELVRGALTIPELLLAYGYEPTSAKGDRYHDCPSCGSGCRGKFTTAPDICMCHACGFAGDVFAVAGAILDLSRSDFDRVVNTCASIAGVSGDYDAEEVAKTIAKRAARREHEDAKRAQLRERAESGAKAVWHKLSQRSSKGQQYVASRAIMPTGAGSDCRYTGRSVCLPLWREGSIVNVVGRRFDNGQPKIRGLNSCGTRGHFGRARYKHAGPIVVVEGFFDYLSARELSPTRLVLGAHGCSNLPYVAEVAAKLAVGTELGLVLIPHHDEAGRSSMEKAKEAAIAAGVSPAAITVFEVAEGCNDLNDHLCANGRKTP